MVFRFDPTNTNDILMFLHKLCEVPMLHVDMLGARSDSVLFCNSNRTLIVLKDPVNDSRVCQREVKLSNFVGPLQVYLTSS